MGRYMVAVTRSERGFVVVLGGEELAVFAYLLDASCFAQQLIERGLAQNMRLPCGMTM